jgi:hypothetical protein
MFRDWVLPKGQMGYTYVHSPWEADLELNFQVAPAIHLLSLIKGEKFLTLPAFFFLINVVLGVHCDIYRSSYNIS